MRRSAIARPATAVGLIGLVGAANAMSLIENDLHSSTLNGLTVHRQYAVGQAAYNLLIWKGLRLVAGGGFEPPTFGL